MCDISFHVINSAIKIDCTDELIELIEHVKKDQIFRRIGIYDDSNYESFKGCEGHIDRFTTKFNKSAICHWPSQEPPRRLTEAQTRFARPSTEKLSKAVMFSENYLIAFKKS